MLLLQTASCGLFKTRLKLALGDMLITCEFRSSNHFLITFAFNDTQSLHMSYLLLSQDEDPPCFDRVPGWQVLPRAFFHPILVGLPDTIACWPRHAYVMPLPICHGYGQRHRLCTKGDGQVDRCTNNGENGHSSFWKSLEHVMSMGTALLLL